ncbi:alpha-amylase family glycosyl hydrolase [Paenibacillus alba]|uniref:Alpha-amylase family glycosyl hydrolase n=1 Tax=Paenibacillus alba TaxID=1197127 RepID=A0ABU6GCM5_9BACL|nr:alpha-amylase family glycosyl hydrolase [Paenibacillus alba]MEC0231389.1 alpha-amylase family glycosyl hydrolase [Paenibacillus alba]
MRLWNNKKGFRFVSAFTAVLLTIQLLAGWFSGSIHAVAAADEFIDQPGGNNKWVVVGSFQGWDNGSTDSRMKHLAGEFYAYSRDLPAGSYEFKIVKSGSWDGYANNGNNFAFSLGETTKVMFYLNDELGQARISLPGVAGIQQYISVLGADQQPRLVGSIQPVFGEAEWSPAGANQQFVDYNFNNTIYKLQRHIPIGSYEAKVVFGKDWNMPNYGTDTGANLKLAALDAAEVTFTIDNSAPNKALTNNYVAKEGDFDGLIKKESLIFDSRSITYKKPFGAIPAGGQDLTLRIGAAKGDLQTAKAELTGPDGLSNAYLMKKVTTVGDKEYWEVTVPAASFAGKVGIWGYKFILVDGSTKVEYGDDNTRGGMGAVADEGALPYDLTVYAPDYKTPDWMKNAVVYQIFPDRFFDGSKDNNRAKTADGARGVLDPKYGTSKNGQKLQYFDGGVVNDPTPDQVWGGNSAVPENPDRTKPENKPYYPDAKTDGAWTNEFYGGDVQGIQQKLDYLKALGITAVYLNPVSWAASNHKYDATDYKHLDPMFGQPVYNTPGDPASGLNYVKTREASDLVFENFTKAARAVGIKVINDGVFNHVGDDSIYFDRYSKYPEIGAYEYWAAVFDKMNATHISQEQAESEVRASFTSQTNPMTGINYKWPEDFRYVSWFTVSNEKVKDRDDDNLHYRYDAWWGYDSLPVMDAKEPQMSPTAYLPADTLSLPGEHEWNNIHYRDNVIGHSLNGLSEADAQKAMQFANSQRWLWMGTSGWRLDVAPDVSAGTWGKFREAVKSTTGRTNVNGSAMDEPVIIGEEWGVATKFLLGDQFDSVMNYRFRGALQSFLSSGNADTFNQALESIREDYPKQAWEALMNLVDSHDTTRSITKYDHPEWEEEHLIIAPEASERAKKLQELTAIFQMGYPGAPTIYYGDEVGLTGTKDPDSRRFFPWERVTANGDGSFSGTGAYQNLLNVYQKAVKVRGDNAVFRTGELKAVYTKGNAIAYARKNDSRGALLVVNRGAEALTMEADVAGFLPDGLKLTDQLYGSAKATVVSGKISLTIPALTGFMMVSDSELQAVPQVTGVRSAGGNGQVMLSWNAVSGAESYQIYRAAIEGGAVQLVGSTNNLNQVDMNVVNGTKYYYAVTARIGAGESFLSDMTAATPAFTIASVGTPSTVTENVYAGVGKTTGHITVNVRVPGLTDDPAFTGKEAANLLARLAYYKDGSDPLLAQDTKLRYDNDQSGGTKQYWGAFEPTEAGIYQYYAKFSTDNGENYTQSSTVTLEVYSDPNDKTAPSAPALSTIAVESNRAQLTWTSDDNSIAGFEVYRQTVTDSTYQKIATLAATARGFTDYAVSNDTLYTYQVAAFDQAYNRSLSEKQSVTPKLVMVDVLLRLHLPDYTPTSDDINIAGSLNGWNASSTKLHVPSGATDRGIVEYSFKMMAGKSIEYKYTRGTWETEAFTSHSRTPGDRADYGNWAYSSTDTNMKLTIQNQGGNQMVVNDYVLRWVDMPMILTMPRITYGSNVSYSTEESSFKLKGVVPYGVNFTMNGQPLPEGSMDAIGNVELSSIPLKPGLNKFEMHIEPTPATLALPWYTDKGRAGQATKTIALTITRTSGGESNSEPTVDKGTNSGGTVTTDIPSGPKQVDDSALKKGKDGKVVIELRADEREIQLPPNAAGLLGSNVLEIKQGIVTLQFPSGLLAALAKLIPGDAMQDAKLSITVNTLATEVGQKLIRQGAASAGADVKSVSDVYDFSLSAVTKDGKVLKLSAFEQPITLNFHVQEGANLQLSGVYNVSEAGQLDYIGGTWQNGILTAKVSHFSKYAVLAYNKSFADLPLDHWAAAAVKELAAKQVVEGITLTSFAPEREVTRAEFSAMLVRALKLPTKAAAALPFTDVESNAWYAAAVAAAYANGIVGGRDSAAFAPDSPITRQEMAAMVVRAYGVQSGKNVPSAAGGQLDLNDAVGIAPWAEGFVRLALELKLMQGRGEREFVPEGITTRAESAQVLLNLLQVFTP